MATQPQSTVQHWEVIADGVHVKIESARDLWEHALGYFQWCDLNPIQKPEFIRSGADAGLVKHVPIPRPYTIHSMCLHLGLTREWLYDVSKQNEKNDFYFVANKILQIIYTQKLEYAMTGVFSPVVASRELGLHNNDKTPPGSPVIQIDVLPSPKLLTDERDVDLPETKNTDFENGDFEKSDLENP